MRKFLSLRLFSVLMLILCSISVVYSQTTVNQTSFSALSADNIDGDPNLSYSTAKNSATTAPAINSNQIRLYQGNPGGSITITAKNGAKITSVGVTTAMATTVATKVDNGSESEHESLAANATHTVSNINATNVEFICYGSDKNSRLYVSGITVTYVASNKTTATVTFVGAEETYNVTLGETFIAPIATTNSDATITYTSSNEDCATVANDGSVTLLSKGTTVITAAVEATEEYTSASASYTINVTKPLPANTIFYESFDDCNKDGGNDGKWASINTTGDISADNTGWTFVSGNQASECARFGTGSAKGSAKTPKLNLIEGSVNCTLTFKAAAWNGNSEKTGLDITIEGGGTLGTSTVALKKGAWTEYTIDITGATKDTQITFAAQNASNNRFFLDEVLITKVTATSITVNEANKGFATYYNSKSNVKLPAGVRAYTYQLNGTALKADNIADGDEEGMEVVAAGVAVVLYTTGNSYVITETTEDAFYSASELEGKTLLRGEDEVKTVEAAADETLYILGNGSKGIGFYQAYADGNNSFSCGAHKAYLAVPSTSTEARFFSLGFGDETTAIENAIVNSQKNGIIYNLAGQKVDNSFKGIIIINGKKYLNK